LILTFDPEQDAEVDADAGMPAPASIEGLELTAGGVDQSTAREAATIAGLESDADEPAEVAALVDSLHTIEADSWSEPLEPVPLLSGLESPRVSLTGTHPVLSALIDAPPMSGQEFGDLSLRSDGSPPRADDAGRHAHDLSLPSTLPLLGNEPATIDLQRVMETPSETPVVSGNNSTADLPVVASAGSAGVSRDTTELVAQDGAARTTDELLVVAAEEIDETTRRSLRREFSLDGDETPDAWVEAALGASDDFSLDHLLTMPAAPADPDAPTHEEPAATGHEAVDAASAARSSVGAGHQDHAPNTEQANAEQESIEERFARFASAQDAPGDAPSSTEAEGHVDDCRPDVDAWADAPRDDDADAAGAAAPSPRHADAHPEAIDDMRTRHDGADGKRESHEPDHAVQAQPSSTSSADEGARDDAADAPLELLPPPAALVANDGGRRRRACGVRPAGRAAPAVHAPRWRATREDAALKLADDVSGPAGAAMRVVKSMTTWRGRRRCAPVADAGRGRRRGARRCPTIERPVGDLGVDGDGTSADRCRRAAPDDDSGFHPLTHAVVADDILGEPPSFGQDSTLEFAPEPFSPPRQTTQQTTQRTTQRDDSQQAVQQPLVRHCRAPRLTTWKAMLRRSTAQSDAATTEEDLWPEDQAPEILIDGEWHNEHMGDLVSGEPPFVPARTGRRVSPRGGTTWRRRSCGRRPTTTPGPMPDRQTAFHQARERSRNHTPRVARCRSVEWKRSCVGALNSMPATWACADNSARRSSTRGTEGKGCRSSIWPCRATSSLGISSVRAASRRSCCASCRRPYVTTRSAWSMRCAPTIACSWWRLTSNSPIRSFAAANRRRRAWCIRACSSCRQ
jgi:hypothetical protein